MIFMEYVDYYSTLGVDKSASQEDIKKEYRKLAKKHHPDLNRKNKGAEDKFKIINEAYQVLGDPEKRKKYDDLSKEAHNGSNFEPSTSDFGNNVRYEYSDAENNDFSDFFNMFFGGGKDFSVNNFRQERNSQKYPVTGTDIEAEIQITLKEGFNGVEERIKLENDRNGRTITFRIPAGIMTGEKVKLSGQGNPGRNGGKNGDLYLSIILKKNEQFEIDGLNLSADLKILPWDAALGSEVKVATLEGKILVKIPSGVQTGSKIRVPGKGYKNKNGKCGDLFLKVRIVNPTVISNEVRELYEKLKKLTAH